MRGLLRFELVFALASALTVYAQTSEPARFPVETNGKWGFIDRAGKLLVPATFSDAREFYEGIAAVKAGSKWGFIDEGGGWLIKPKFDDAQDFDAGFAAVKVRSFWGFIDRQGEFTVRPKWEFVRCSHNGSPPMVNTSGDHWRYLDETRSRLSAHKTNILLGFSEGMAPARGSDSKVGFVDVSGHFVISPRFDAARGFSESLAAVQIGDKWGAIDKTGRVVIQPQFDLIYDFNEGAAVVDFGSREGMIRSDGSWLVRPQYIDIERMSESRAVFWDESGRLLRGYLDASGNVAIPMRFRRAKNFRGGLAQVQTGDGIGYIDRNGNYVWPPTR